MLHFNDAQLNWRDTSKETVEDMDPRDLVWFVFKCKKEAKYSSQIPASHLECPWIPQPKITATIWMIPGICTETRKLRTTGSCDLETITAIGHRPYWT